MDRLHHFMIFTTGKARKQVQEFRTVFSFIFLGLKDYGTAVNPSTDHYGGCWKGIWAWRKQITARQPCGHVDVKDRLSFLGLEQKYCMPE
jgi:hypothetical protein